MATLILTTVGNVVGGPIGGAIGGIIGQQIDGAIFGPKRRQGPRLGDLSIQTSSYGTAIPKIFGTMRVAGTVIWATDLREEQAAGGGSKGQPRTAGYSYSASFAVALSARPIRAVRRIWADGKLLRGASGDFKSRTGYRLYRGTENQQVDPFIASAEGMTKVTAFRGIAYAMFEDFQLADYGNRIPSLTFEVEADEGAVAVGRIAEELSGGLISGAATIALDGYAASGDSVRGAIEDLFEILPVTLCDVDGRLTVQDAPIADAVTIRAADQGAHSGDQGGFTEFNRRALVRVPDEVTLAYHDPAREYQTSVQRASTGGSSIRGERRAVAAVLSANRAKAIAEGRLAALLARRETATVHLARAGREFRPGYRLRLAGRTGAWKVARWELGSAGLITLALEKMPNPDQLLGDGADAGRPVGSTDEIAGPTTLFLFDIPAMAERFGEEPRIIAVAAGAGKGWRGAELNASFDGENWVSAGRSGSTALCGFATGRLGWAGSTLFDEFNSLEVELLNSAMWLQGRSDVALLGGANLAVLGDEIVQFGKVEALGSRRFKLSRLLRGRFGTEWAAGLHKEGDRFALLGGVAASEVSVPSSKLGQPVRVAAQGIGDGEPRSQEISLTAESVRPPSPVHLRASRLGSGDILIRWTRRSRRGWDWLDNNDAPLGEEREKYRLNLTSVGERSAETVEPSFLYTADQQQLDAVAGELTIEVVQLGTVAASRPARITFS